MDKIELKPQNTSEQPKILKDPESGLERVVYEKDGEITEAFLRTPDGKTLSYIDFEEISKLQDQERILEMMGIKVSAAITELIQADATKAKYYIKFMEFLK